MTEYRQSPRKAVERILSIQMEPNISAIVLNISDEGLGFHALTPVTQTGTIRFSFWENGQHIQASGELVWTDSTKKTGGLRFVSMSRASREQIWSWVDQAAVADAGAVSEPEARRLREPPVPGAASLRPNVASAPFMPPPEAPVIQPTMPGFALLEGDQSRTPYTWDQQMSLPDSRPKFFSGFLTGAIVTVILAAIVLFTYGDPSALLAQIRARTGIGAAASPSPPSPAAVLPQASPDPPPAGIPAAPVTQTPPEGADHSSAGASAGRGAAQSEASPPPANNSLPTTPGSPLPKADNGDNDLVLAERYLRDRSTPASTVAAAHFLWTSVQKGNVSAEIALADLYVRGNGVPKSCDQARVLLRAAAEKGSRVASDELSQIVRTGCR